MGKAFLKKTTSLLQAKRKRKRWQRTMISLSLVVAMVTSCLLIHPAITMERTAICGQEEHTHTKECYEHRLVCGKTEQSAVPATEEKVLNCSKAVHEHGEGCYDAEGQLVCTTEAHNHDDSCYQIIRTEGVEGHAHTDACYEDALICGKQEHTHTEACYPKETEAATQAQTQAQTQAETTAAVTETQPAAPQDVTVTEVAKVETATEKATEAEKPEARTLTVKNEEYTIQVDCPADAKIPKNAVLSIREIKKNDSDYNSTYERAASVVLMKTAKKIETVRFFDLSISVDGKEIQPKAAVTVKITFTKPIQSPEGSEVRAIRLGDDADVLATNTNKANGSWSQITFKAKKLTVYVAAEIAVPVAETAVTEAETSEVMMLAAETEETETEAATEVVTEALTEESTEAATEESTETFTEDATEEATEAVTEESTEAVTEEMTEESTEEPDTEEMTEEDPATPHILTAKGSDYTVEVTYTTEAGIPEGAELQVREIAQGTAEYESYYQQAMAAVQEGDTTSISFARFFDISFVYEGEEIEPSAPVAVKITYADAVEVPEAGEVKSVHFGDEAEVLNVQTNEKNGAMDEVTFDAESFSVYGIVGTETLTGDVITADGEMYTISVTFGADAKIPDGATLKVEEIDSESEIYKTEFDKAEELLQKEDAELHVQQARFFDVKIMDGDTEVQPQSEVRVTITAEDISSDNDGLYVTHTHDDTTVLVDAITQATSENEAKYEFKVDNFSYLGAFSANAEISMSVGDTATLNGTTSTNHTWSSDKPAIVQVSGSGASATITALSVGTATITHRYTRKDKNRKETYTIVVTAASTGKIRVYVYVCANGISDECLELLGIDKNTLDGNGYFPAGEIELDASYLNGKTGTTTGGEPLINSTSDWESVLASLSNMNTSNFTSKDSVDSKDYTVNKDNCVGEYLSQARGDIGKRWGSQCTALFYWPSGYHSYGFDDQTVMYHLDLFFNTKEITFITGNNGITSGSAADNTTVDSRTYITGSSIQEPRNLTIPDGYRFVGYYTDADFTTPWDGIGTPLNEDQTVYIKITPLENVIIYYKNVTGSEAGSLSSDSEGLNPVTGVAVGSTATPKEGYQFIGWYADKDCTILLSRDQKYVPDKGDDNWIDGTTYYAKFATEGIEDQNFIIVQKTFSGITKDQIPSDFTITVTNNSTGKQTLLGKASATISADGLTWSWRIDGATIGEYTVTERNETVTNYTVTTEGAGQTVTVAAAKMTISTIEHETTCSKKNWPVQGGKFFAGTLTDGGIVVITEHPLSAAQREAVKTYVLKINGPWKEPVYYYSLDEQVKNGAFSIKGGTVTYNSTSAEVVFSDTNLWQHVATLSYDEEEAAKNPEISVTNTYVPQTKVITIVKTDDSGNKLAGATFNLVKGSKAVSGSPFNTNTSNGNTFELLYGDDYKLTETKAPDGYVILDSDVYFKVGANGVQLVDSDGNAKDYDNVSISDDGLTVKVTNTPGKALPNTGGSGTLPYTLGGLLLMCAAALMYGFRMRRRERRLN